MISPFEIYITYITWGDDGKHRPVLVASQMGNMLEVYPITTQFAQKSEAIKAKYFKIVDWAQAGLHRQSYVDSGARTLIPENTIDKKRPIGKLSEADINRFIAFLLT